MPKKKKSARERIAERDRERFRKIFTPEQIEGFERANVANRAAQQERFQIEKRWIARREPFDGRELEPGSEEHAEYDLLEQDYYDEVEVWNRKHLAPAEAIETPAKPAESQDVGAKPSPDDLIATAVACKTFNISRTTLFRRVKNETLKSYRPKNVPKNATHNFSERDLAALFPRVRP